MIQNNQRRTSLSPRYQIPIRTIMRLQTQNKEENPLETVKQIDQYLAYYSKENHLLESSKTQRISIQQNSLNQSYQEYVSKKQREMKQESLTTILKTCSEYFINTLYMALIGDAVSQDKQTQILAQILLQFGIQPIQLKNMDDYQKRNYIIEKFHQTIDGLLVRWKERVESRHQLTQITEVETRLEKQPLKWLYINTKYKNLKQQLAQILYRKLDELQNLEKLIKQQQHLYLNDVTRPTVFELIQRIDPTIGRIFNSLKSSKKLIKKREIVKKNIQPLIWNNNVESQFFEVRQFYKTKYTNQISSSNFNIMGYLPLILEVHKHSNQEDSYEEIKFAKFFSKFLAKCVDKNQLQSAVNLIDSDQISALEGNLAEHIIETHLQIVKTIQNARFKFLQQKTNQLKSESQLRDKNQKQLQIKNQQYKAYFERKKRYQMIYKRCQHYNYFVFYFASKLMKNIRKRRRFQFNKKQTKKENCVLIKKVSRQSKSPELRNRCISDYSTGPIKFKVNQNITKIQAIIKIQCLIRGFLARQFTKKYRINKHRILFIKLKKKKN